YLPFMSRAAAGTALAVAALAAAVLGAVPRAEGAALETGVVDVTTNLAYESGRGPGTGGGAPRAGGGVTNNHRERGASTIKVVDPSTGRTYSAFVRGYSVSGDIAVLQLRNASGLRTVTLAGSAAVKVGQRVTAVGNAGGAGGKPTSAPGKVTGVGKSIVASDGDGLSERLVGLIRTNAAIRPGDSGGPLLATLGRGIGINTAASVGFQFQSTAGFAIPIDRALSLTRQIEAGKASATVHIGSTPFLGVSVGSSSDALTPGVAVVEVVSGSPADRAGIVAGD